jgi:hypothetical protein
MPGLTVENPVIFSNAIKSLNVLPGDVLQLRAGTYTGDWIVQLNGTAAAPITIMPYNNEQVILDGSLIVAGKHVTLADMEIMNSSISRTRGVAGVNAFLEGFRIHGCLIHDLHLNGIRMIGAGDGHICENVILNNGWAGGDGWKAVGI